MDKHKKFWGAVAVAALLLAPFAGAQTVIVNDQFDSGDLQTNPTGVGTGYQTRLDTGGSATEAGGVVTLPGAPTTTNANMLLVTNESFAINTATPITASFTLANFERTATSTSTTTRFHVGFTFSPIGTRWNPAFRDVLNGLPTTGGQYLEGIWVVLHERYDWAALGGALVAGEGALCHVATGGTVTILEEWTWDPSCVTFDLAGLGTVANRTDRIKMNLVPPSLTVNLTCDATGYNLSFSSGGGVVVPGPFTGTWAAKSVVNEFNAVGAVAAAFGGDLEMVVDSLVVTSAGSGGEGEGEGEGEPQTTILSNVYPPFIDEGSAVILTAPLGSDWQWSKDGSPISGATDRELIFNPVKASDAGSYTVSYNDGTAPATTPAFVLTVSPEGSVPVAGLVGLAALLGGCALGGAASLRRRKH